MSFCFLEIFLNFWNLIRQSVCFSCAIVDAVNFVKKSYNYTKRLTDIVRLMYAKTDEEACRIVKEKEILESMYDEMKKLADSATEIKRLEKKKT